MPAPDRVPPQQLLPFPGAELRFDTYFSEPQGEDRSVVSIGPALWRTDASGLVVGLRVRSNYRGRYNRWTVWLHRGLEDVFSQIDGVRSATLGSSIDFRVRLENPYFLRSPGATQSIEGWVQEGVAGVRFRIGRASWSSDSTRVTRTGWLGQWVATPQTAFLDAKLWDNAGTVEAGLFRAWQRVTGPVRRNMRLEARVGYVYTRNRDAFSSGQYDGQLFGRLTGAAWVRRSVLGFDVGVRAFAGAYVAGDPPVNQRGIMVHGADPYETLENPMVRAQGAPFVMPDVYYHSPGNLNLRGYKPSYGGRWGVALNLEVHRRLLAWESGVVRSIGLVGFWDGGVVDTLAVRSFSGQSVKPLYDAGPGVQAWFRIGDVSFPLRVEFPVYLSSPSAGHVPDKNRYLDFRWLVSLQPIF